jgi:hypothetical protein
MTALNGLGPVIASPVIPIAQGVSHRQHAAESPGLPARFPGSLDCELAWTGQQFTRESDYVCHLAEADIQEVEDALRYFKGMS